MLLAGAAEAGEADACAPFARAAAGACGALGARVIECAAVLVGGAPLEWEAIERRARDALEAARGGEALGVDVLVVDGASLFACGGQGRAALRTCADATWTLTRTLAGEAMLGRGRGGRIIFIAPPPDAGEHAPAALAALENLARTLSIEWARHSITAVAIAPASGSGPREAPPGPARANEELGALVAYLASPAGAYFSGCLLDLRGAEEPLASSRRPQPGR